ncbi:MAG: hypothetical protein EHM42_06195 [Planctomycetaceae bacterium]|nr:MAG: hypothetical protein EHM42_06195 [Planctomycetaceae bacterium]
MTVEERLELLEKNLRRWRFVSLGLVVSTLVLGTGLAWSIWGTRTAIRTRGLYVVNEKGNAIELTTSNEGDGLISVNDHAALPRVMFGNSQKGYGKLELYTGHSQRMVMIGGTGSGGQVAVFNNSGHRVVDMQAKKTNSGAIIVSDFDGNIVQGIEGDTRTAIQPGSNRGTWR